MKPNLEIPCPTCHAAAGSPCINKRGEQPSATPHACRNRQPQPRHRPAAEETATTLQPIEAPGLPELSTPCAADPLACPSLPLLRRMDDTRPSVPNAPSTKSMSDRTARATNCRKTFPACST